MDAHVPYSDCPRPIIGIDSRRPAGVGPDAGDMPGWNFPFLNRLSMALSISSSWDRKAVGSLPEADVAPEREGGADCSHEGWRPCADHGWLSKKAIGRTSIVGRYVQVAANSGHEVGRDVQAVANGMRLRRKIRCACTHVSQRRY